MQMRKNQELTRLIKYYHIQQYQMEGKQKQQTPSHITFEKENLVKGTKDVEKQGDSFTTHKCKNILTLWTATRKNQLLLKKPYNILLHYLTR